MATSPGFQILYSSFLKSCLSVFGRTAAILDLCLVTTSDGHRSSSTLYLYPTDFAMNTFFLDWELWQKLTFVRLRITLKTDISL
jgi:hypothetical protein